MKKLRFPQDRAGGRRGAGGAFTPPEFEVSERGQKEESAPPDLKT